MQEMIVPAGDFSVRCRTRETEVSETSAPGLAAMVRYAFLLALVCSFWGLVAFTALRVALQ